LYQIIKKLIILYFNNPISIGLFLIKKIKDMLPFGRVTMPDGTWFIPPNGRIDVGRLVLPWMDPMLNPCLYSTAFPIGSTVTSPIATPSVITEKLINKLAKTLSLADELMKYEGTYDNVQYRIDYRKFLLNLRAKKILKVTYVPTEVSAYINAIANK
jgi:hypothetical protein